MTIPIGEDDDGVIWAGSCIPRSSILAVADRDGAPAEIAVTQFVPGDVVHLRVGDVVPADLRLREVTSSNATSRC